MSETLERLREAEAAEAELTRMQTLAAEAPALRAQAEAEQQREYQARRLEAAKAQAREAVTSARPEIETVRAEFVTWTQTGWDLVRQLNSIERPLIDNLAALAGVAASAARSELPPGDEEAHIMLDLDSIVAGALQEAGALADDLEALPPGGNQFSQELEALFARYASCYHPGQRGRQFRRGGGPL